MGTLKIQARLEEGDHYTTNEPMLYATLGTLGFRLLGTRPISVYINANALVDVVDRNSGAVDKIASIQCHCERDANHPVHGRITAPQVECAHVLARALHQQKLGDNSDSLKAAIEKLKLGCNKKLVKVSLFQDVEEKFHHLSNFVMICDTIQQLSSNPLLSFTKSIANNGVGHTINPLEVEDSAMRRSERLFKGEKGRVHNPTH